MLSKLKVGVVKTKSDRHRRVLNGRTKIIPRTWWFCEGPALKECRVIYSYWKKRYSTWVTAPSGQLGSHGSFFTILAIIVFFSAWAFAASCTFCFVLNNMLISLPNLTRNSIWIFGTKNYTRSYKYVCIPVYKHKYITDMKKSNYIL